jgi:hypothetical protein
MHLRSIIAAVIAALHILDEPRHDASRRCLAAIHYYGTEEHDDVAA